jgi:uncharacterized protein (TIGR00730 family)
MRTLKRICVYCGSSAGARPVYAQAARELGRMLAELGIGVVYGGGRVGLMGILADAALEAGGEVIGVIPRSLQEKELGHGSVTELHVVETMHQRKEKMADLSDGFITLPGGIGTLEELFETFTWLQLGFHEKPVALLNVDGFYQGLTTFVRHLSEQQFLKPEHEACLIVEDSPHALLERMESFTPPDLGKWFLPSLGADVR